MPRGRDRSDGVTDLAGTSDAAPTRALRIRFAGLSSGGGAFIAAWLVGAAVARLTGAAAVLLLLASTAVALAATVISARRAVRAVGVTEVVVATLTTVDVATPMTIGLRRPRRHVDGVVRIWDGGVELAAVDFDQFDDHDRTHVSVTFDVPGVVTNLTVEILSAGITGLVWMRRRETVVVEPTSIAPSPVGPTIDITAEPSRAQGVTLTRYGPKQGDVDGVRMWRDGDGDTAVHWPSTLRAGSLIVHDREASLDRTWVVEVTGSSLDDDTAARMVHTLLEGLRLGHDVVLRRHALGSESSGNSPDEPSSKEAVGTSTTDISIAHPDDARRMSAELIGPRSAGAAPRTRWFRRPIRLRAPIDTFTTVGVRSRWLTAAASMTGLGMLVGALGSDPTTTVTGGGGLVVGAVVSLWTSRRGAKPWWLRVMIPMATTGALAYIASTVGGITGLAQALRGPMPDLLMLLLVIHGFEVVDRRTLRVHQAISGVVLAYATGLRIDDRVGLWMAAWGIFVVAAVRASTWRAGTQQRVDASTARRAASFSGAIGTSCAATLAILLIVPVPDGPARLGLPAVSNDAPSAPTAGGLAGPTGAPPAPSDGTRGSLGEVGGYPGFSETMDTSVRGDLGDEIVLRVRAPKPDFWRGQTFTDFDGRSWSVDPATGRRRPGPQVDIPPTLGDVPLDSAGVEIEELVQTYYVEADLPNVIFAATRPSLVTLDGDLYPRPDGAIRSDVTLTKGSVYTVVSERVQVTAELLRRQGDVAAFFARFADPGQRELLDPYLAVPESTTQRTLDLATELRTPGASTYDTILAYQAWLSQNTAYDLDAPVPAEGADAVDDFLFVSQRGFCEQIASSLAIMLRTQGVPARIATGYVPGVRDKISGVFEVRASDAHAWVEVWFPGSGWQAFDPTASVPLSGEAPSGSVGGDLLTAAVSGVTSRPVEVGLAAAIGLMLLGAVRWVSERLRRRRRGRWGVLQDQFSALADSSAISNPQRASSLDDPRATDLGNVLDRAAFDPEWHDTDDEYRQTKSTLRELLRSG